jgi:hypothetical protein
MKLPVTDTEDDLGDALHAVVHARPVDSPSPEGRASDITNAWINHRLPQFLSLSDPESQFIPTHVAYVVGEGGALDGMEWLYHALKGDCLGATMVEAERLVQHAARLSCETSDTGWGAELVFDGRSFISFGSYWTEDGLTSSNQRETTAVLRALLYFRPMIVASNIRATAVRTDNMVTVYNLGRQRAPSGKLLQATRAIFSLLT